MLGGPSREDMLALAKQAVRNLPPHFREQARDVVVRVRDFATREQLDAVDIADRWHLSGLYEGHPITEQSVWASGDLPPKVTLFRQPLLAEMRETGVGLEELVRHVVIHELGHHFGFSDEDMHALEDEVDD